MATQKRSDRFDVWTYDPYSGTDIEAESVTRQVAWDHAKDSKAPVWVYRAGTFDCVYKNGADREAADYGAWLQRCPR